MWVELAKAVEYIFHGCVYMLQINHVFGNANESRSKPVALSSFRTRHLNSLILLHVSRIASHLFWHDGGPILLVKSSVILRIGRSVNLIDSPLLVIHPSFGGYVVCCVPLIAALCNCGAFVPQVDTFSNSSSRSQSWVGTRGSCWDPVA
eukprot:6173724-Pleurochrysis_carterae.AAC.1